MNRPWRIGVDVGGTFTDGIVWDERTGVTATTKVPSTPADPGQAFLTAVARLLAENGVAADTVSYVVHGTTVATNTVLQHRLAPTAFVTTAGFRDLLEIARQVRADAYDVFAVKPRPLVPRQLCFEVTERMSAEGEVLTPLDEASVGAVAETLRGAGVAAVAVCLLHAWRNPAHERRVAELLRAALPDTAVAISSDLASEFREFPRACTTIINVGLMPTVSRYLSRLDSRLGELGLEGSRLVMQSNGGIADFANSAEMPVFLIESGPAAGVVGAAHIARELGEANVISFDMGGTTAKVGLVRDGTPHRVREFEVGLEASRTRNFNAGAAGYPVLTPAVDLIEIGTGGGSVAWIDDGGKLRVGPISAGADPGPACYGQGGDQATITDADLVLGWLNPDYFLGGEMRLDVKAARAAVGALAARLGIDVVATAAGIVDIANSAMSQALRVVSVQRGYDPRDFRLVAFGGAGPVHAAALAAEAGIPAVVVPLRPGIASALGLLVADLKHDFAATEFGRLDEADPARLEARFDGLIARGRAPLKAEGVAADRMRFERSIDVRYVGQSYHLSVTLPEGPIDAAVLAGVRRRFNEMHHATYGYSEASEPCEMVNLRVSALGLIAKPPLGNGATAGGAEGATAARKAPRPAYFGGHGFLETAVWDRRRLPAGAAFEGPAIVEEADSTTLVPPGWRCSVGRFGTLMIAHGTAA